ncbi:heme o synthase [Taibaiella koreensis]|uniref:heme o synthase n=1 Tax=Taibaiella koreensis TaxID=1268548 RepID=UPI000E59EBB1|nr:heme o synthase [Taibaiella koreensis]
MLREEPLKVKEYSIAVAKLRDYAQLMKPNLSFMVVFSSVVGYLMVPGVALVWKNVLLLFLGGMLVTNGANIINQILERYSDRLMKRTMLRPLPDERMGTTEAWILCILSAAAGVGLLAYYFNLASALLSLLSLLLYGFAYTPMKKIHPIATFVGAIPGALPPLIGWVAATGSFGLGGWSLFLIQFFWQFPHFWAIAWVGYEDYLKAGIRMLPSREGKTSFTGLQCIFYSLTLIPLVMLPHQLGLSGSVGMWVSIACGLLYCLASFVFYLRNDRASAKRLMYASFIYLPTVLLALLIDKL